MLCFQQKCTGEVYVSLHDPLVWTESGETRTTTVYCRKALDRGCPERECGSETLSLAIFSSCFEAISLQQASQQDPLLVDFVHRLAVYPDLPSVLQHLRRGSYLHLVACASTPTEELFDVYQASEALPQHLHFLNPLLEPFLPWVEIDGVRHFAVPCATDLRLASRTLVLALERCLWGAHTAPGFSYAYGYELDELEEKGDPSA